MNHFGRPKTVLRKTRKFRSSQTGLHRERVLLIAEPVGVYAAVARIAFDKAKINPARVVRVGPISNDALMSVEQFASRRAPFLVVFRPLHGLPLRGRGLGSFDFALFADFHVFFLLLPCLGLKLAGPCHPASRRRLFTRQIAAHGSGPKDHLQRPARGTFLEIRGKFLN